MENVDLAPSHLLGAAADSEGGVIETASSAAATTVIAGNCGVGFAPARRDMHEFVVQ